MLEFVTENQEDHGLFEGHEHLEWENTVGANANNVKSIENGSGGVEMDEDNEDMLNSIRPCVGMEFNSPEEAYDFYNYFARRTGFSVRKYATAKGIRNIGYTEKDARNVLNKYACRRDAENDEDYESNYTNRALKFSMVIEKEVTEVYTKEIFARFQQQLREGFSYRQRKIEETANSSKAAHIATKGASSLKHSSLMKQIGSAPSEKLSQTKSGICMRKVKPLKDPPIVKHKGRLGRQKSWTDNNGKKQTRTNPGQAKDVKKLARFEL
ncbi:hypothetical protein IFM89_032959 [Coptis chinensis]|uniref:Protein FAR1-RELATED SEQUENCE n=1 Tax=Coptis chinensis TaxID=261450 RepID=A0A835HNM2_9MAGN|nr:hypothetical protein IFM89_032959 [Coptis chinensis]